MPNNITKNHKTVTELSEMFPVKRNKILYALQTGTLKGTKIGWVWFVNLDDFIEWARERGYVT